MCNSGRSVVSRLDSRSFTELSNSQLLKSGLCILLYAVIIGIMPACGKIASIGLRPVYPPLEKGSFKLWGEFVQVNSLQPTLRWQVFPRAGDLEADEGGDLKRVEDVSYELRIWKTVNGYSGRRVYAREGLITPYHQLEQVLEPSSRYLWTVRARFVLDGLPQVTEWGLAGYTLRGSVVPNPSCFRFMTPASGAGA